VPAGRQSAMLSAIAHISSAAWSRPAACIPCQPAHQPHPPPCFLPFPPVQAMPSASPSGKPAGAPAAKQGGAPHNAAQYSPEQLAFLKRTGASVQGTPAAPKPAAQPARRATSASASPTPKPAAGGASAQYTPEQLEFLRRKGISPEVRGCNLPGLVCSGRRLGWCAAARFGAGCRVGWWVGQGASHGGALLRSTHSCSVLLTAAHPAPALPLFLLCVQQPAAPAAPKRPASPAPSAAQAKYSPEQLAFLKRTGKL
jgi:hypothetical protein